MDIAEEKGEEQQHDAEGRIKRPAGISIFPHFRHGRCKRLHAPALGVARSDADDNLYSESLFLIKEI